MAKDEPRTIEELCDYIVEHADRIFIREQIDGKWGSYALSALPYRLALEHAFRFIKEGRIPVRVLTDEEVAAKKAESGI